MTCSTAPRASSGSTSFMVSATRSTRCTASPSAHTSRTQRSAPLCRLRRRLELGVWAWSPTCSQTSSRIVVHLFQETGRRGLTGLTSIGVARAAQSGCTCRTGPCSRQCGDAARQRGHTRSTRRRTMQSPVAEEWPVGGGEGRHLWRRARSFSCQPRCPQLKVGAGARASSSALAWEPERWYLGYEPLVWAISRSWSGKSPFRSCCSERLGFRLGGTAVPRNRSCRRFDTVNRLRLGESSDRWALACPPISSTGPHWVPRVDPR
jgi:hypothetical protein